MKPQSAKGKGRRLQQWFRDLILENFTQLEPDDVRSTGMGQSGEDLQLSPAARRLFPYSVEAKNCERLNVWGAYEQAAANSGKHEPLLVMKKNRKKPLVVLDAEAFMELVKRAEQ
ncbi:hypothetical protein [Synechococcus phage S-N03]|uniref:Uncharacterized protein n=1 Tax=Synechococcus phage S-N03 TaxID=2718943 RepID=A0A6G8R611_9CAUD|nr:RusA-like Holliday junction resolvase [Synechococcus phage S-N03]QIN96830.1 hypothetical protein [Synechococcus phage S-N03]